MDNLNNFEDLYLYLQITRFTIKDIVDIYVNKHLQPNSKGYIQEALLRVLGGFGCISKLNDFIPCVGKFNKNNLKPIKKYEQVIYTSKNKPITFKSNGGDASDFSLIHKDDPTHYLAFTSKYMETYTLKDLDIQDIMLHASSYSKLSIGIMIPCKDKLNKVKSKSHLSSHELVRCVENAIVIDMSDLQEALNTFRSQWGVIPLKDIDTPTLSTINFRPHQRMSIHKTLSLKTKYSDILWGHVPRSGKSYIMAGCIMEDSKNKSTCNYLIITTAPRETIQQYKKVMSCKGLETCNTILLHTETKTRAPKSNKNIIICSKQFLDKKTEKNILQWMCKMKFDMRFVDESHNGGTTEYSKQMLDLYGKGCTTIHITATYAKPIQHVHIDPAAHILWDLEDITLCKNMCSENRKRLMEKHDDDECMNVCMRYLICIRIILYKIITKHTLICTCLLVIYP
jgi:hypothetical protein